MQLINVVDPEQPYLAGSFATEGVVAVNGDRVYLLAGGALHVLSLGPLDHPVDLSLLKHNP